MSSPTQWADITIPANITSLPLVQAVALKMAQVQGFDKARCYLIELALEEVMTTILRYAYDDGDAAQQTGIQVQFAVRAGIYQLGIVSRGLPFELSMIPDYDPGQLVSGDTESMEEGLSAFLLKHSVDSYRLINQGKQGLRFELEWWLPSGHIADMESDSNVALPDPMHSLSTVGAASEVIRTLDASEAIQLARLVYRSYGYSYVYDDMYYPERIIARHQSGLLNSWVALSPPGEIVGHIAEMKSQPNDPAVEWGIAVVNPGFRGGGMMQRLLQALLDNLARQQAMIVFAHAVTSHIFTQKTCLKFNFYPTALQLCLVPSLSFKHINEQQRQRESTYIFVRCLQALPVVSLFIPKWHYQTLLRLVEPLGLDLPLADPEKKDLSDSTSPPLDTRRQAHNDVLTQAQYIHPHSVFSSEILSHANLASLHVSVIGADHAELLARELRRLCCEKVDVVHLSLDLSDPAAPALVASAEQLGFFVSGFMPMMPAPYTLCLQYLNNLLLDYDAIQTEGEAARYLKDWVKSEQELIEKIQLARAVNSSEKKV